MKKLFLSALLAATLTLSAQPLWLRENVISPNGDKIAFCYKGDVYVVNANGGKALQITTNSSYETSPIKTIKITFDFNRYHFPCNLIIKRHL